MAKPPIPEELKEAGAALQYMVSLFGANYHGQIAGDTPGEKAALAEARAVLKKLHTKYGIYSLDRPATQPLKAP